MTSLSTNPIFGHSPKKSPHFGQAPDGLRHWPGSGRWGVAAGFKMGRAPWECGVAERDLYLVGG